MRFKIAVLMLCFFASFQTVTAAAPPPDIQAEAACLIVAGSQQVLYGKNENAIMYPASTTKIMTLLVALERAADKNTVVTVNKQAADCEGSSLELKENDRLSLQDLLYGLMLVSGNDAAEVVAGHVGGSVPGFVRLMNEKAESLGATRTHFSNPHGLPDPVNHFTTARDMALITAAAFKRPDFLPYVATPSKTVTFRGTGKSRTLVSTNKLLGSYAGADGVKTGYTDDAGLCLVAAAKRNGVQLIAVLFNDDERWQDAAKLLDYGFQTLGGGKP